MLRSVSGVLGAILVISGSAAGCKRSCTAERKAAAVPLGAVPADVDLAADVDAAALWRFYPGLGERLRARWPGATWIELPGRDALRARMRAWSGLDIDRIERLSLAVELDKDGIAALAVIAAAAAVDVPDGGARMPPARPVPALAVSATTPGLRDRVAATAAGRAERALDVLPAWLTAAEPDLDQLRVYLVRSSPPVDAVLHVPVRGAGLFLHTERGASLVIEAAAGQGGPLHQQLVLRKMQARAQLDAMIRAATRDRAAAVRSAFEDLARAADRLRLHRRGDRVTLSCRARPDEMRALLGTLTALAARILAADDTAPP